jgi:hypothetical protein
LNCVRFLAASTHSSLSGIPAASFQEAVAQTLDRAGSCGLSRREDIAHYFKLTAQHGVAFDDLPEHEWIRRRLTDPSVSSPAQRMAIVVDRIALRDRIEDHNRKLREAFSQRENSA